MKISSLVFPTIVFLSYCSTNNEFAEATFSIAAVDNATNQVGGAGSTCIEIDGISIYEGLYYSVPGKSVFLAQGLLHEPSSPVIQLATEMMNNGTLPEDILATITSPEVDAGVLDFGGGTSYSARSQRQYGLVDLSGNAAGYTGESLDPVYAFFGFPPSTQSDDQGSVDTYVFSAQGNVVSEGTVPMLASAFRADEECDDLAQRLMNAVAAVHGAGLGDVRCENGVGSIAFLHVDAADGKFVINIDVPYDSEIDDPFAVLEAAFEEWRESNPCPGTTETGSPTLSSNATSTVPPTDDPEDSSETSVASLLFPSMRYLLSLTGAMAFVPSFM